MRVHQNAAKMDEHVALFLFIFSRYRVEMHVSQEGKLDDAEV
jgi:hypothetical protein